MSFCSQAKGCYPPSVPWKGFLVREGVEPPGGRTGTQPRVDRFPAAERRARGKHIVGRIGRPGLWARAFCPKSGGWNRGQDRERERLERK